MIKSVLTILGLLSLTGCASFEQLQAEGQEIRMRGSMNNSHGFFTHTITTPQGTYTIRGSRTTGTQIYRNK